MMFKLFFTLFIALSISVLYGKGTPVKVLLTNDTWLKADLLKSDKEGNLTIQLDEREQILRRRDFKLVKMTLPPEMAKAEAFLNAGKFGEAQNLLNSLAAAYNFPTMELKIKLLLARLKIAEKDYKSAVSLLEPLLKYDMVMPPLEAASCAYGLLLLGNAWAKLDLRDNAEKAYRGSFELAAPEYSAVANFRLGKMLLEQKNVQGALDCFLENIAVFPPEAPGRRRSLEETITIYKGNKNKKLQLYEEMLKKEYPGGSK
ncbi:MAG: hypothetical protein PHV82_17150 [Victivallaceae bacterium]|nr:hypothetical protein [Victivallaceae bacterium]